MREGAEVRGAILIGGFFERGVCGGDHADDAEGGVGVVGEGAVEACGIRAPADEEDTLAEDIEAFGLAEELGEEGAPDFEEGEDADAVEGGVDAGDGGLEFEGEGKGEEADGPHDDAIEDAVSDPARAQEGTPLIDTHPAEDHDEGDGTENHVAEVLAHGEGFVDAEVADEGVEAHVEGEQGAESGDGEVASDGEGDPAEAGAGGGGAGGDSMIGSGGC